VDSVPDGRSGRSIVEQDLVLAAQRGDSAAFVELLRPRIDRLFALSHRILRDVDGAEDALQDALVVIWRDLRSLRDPARFDAWLHRVVVRECIDDASRERRRIAHVRALPNDEPTAPDGLLTLADRDQIERGLQRLTAEQRAILALHHYAGYEPTEIAGLLGIAPGTARSRLHRAHRAMRAALDADARLTVVRGRSA
jgi:RNA polymerase sigma-70 factor, ECF subfamily